MQAVRRIIVGVAVAFAGLAFAGAPASAAGISVRMEVTKVPQGQWAYASGRTDPGQKIVFVQRWNGSRWYDITGVNVHADGTFRASFKPKDRGIYTFRVRSRSGTTLSNKFYLNVTAPVIYSKSGVGTFRSDYFNLPSEWVVSYTADCSATYGGSDNFVVQLHVGDTYDLLANDIPDPRVANTFYGHDFGGRAYIEVKYTSCAWTITFWGR